MKPIRFACVIVLLVLDSCSSQPDVKDVSAKDKIQDLAFNYYSLKDYKKAAIYLDTLIAMDSSNGDYYYKRGICNSRQIKKKLAINDFQKAISLKHRIDDSYFGIAIQYAFENDSLCLTYLKQIKDINPRFENIDIEIRDCEQRIIDFKQYKPLLDSFNNRK